MFRFKKETLEFDPAIEVESSAVLESRTVDLFRALAQVADTKEESRVMGVRQAQLGYVAQYRETASHVISTTNTLRHIRQFVDRHIKLRHAAEFQAITERWPLKLIRPGPERLTTFSRNLAVIADMSEWNLPVDLGNLVAEWKWNTEALDGHQEYDAADYLGEHVANIIVHEDQLFLRTVFPKTNGIALENSSALLHS